MKKIIILTLGLIAPVNPIFGSDDSVESNDVESKKLATGEKLYKTHCTPCHGYDGDGNGYAKNYIYPQPRDFVWGVYKFRSTPSGDPPTDEDIARTIRRGNPGTSMPAWKQFDDDEINGLVAYLKEFSPDTFEMPGEPIEIGKTPEVNNESLATGRKIFEDAKCWECHGRTGKGDGKKGWQDKFKDDWGNKIYPANLTHSWELRNGATVKDLFRTISTGISGTPMASYADSYNDDDRWSLAHFLKSLQIERRLGGKVMAKSVQSISSSTEDELWDEADYIDIPMQGRKTLIFSTRYFNPRVTNIRVRALYTDTEVAIMLEWDDRKPNKGDDGLPADAIRLQFPVKLSPRIKDPRERNRPVNLWHWETSNDLALEFNAYGPGEGLIRRQDHMDVTAVSNYQDGKYRVIFRRLKRTDDEDDLTFAAKRFIPFSIAAYDGQNNEKGDRGALSARLCYIKM